LGRHEANEYEDVKQTPRENELHWHRQRRQKETEPCERICEPKKRVAKQTEFVNKKRVAKQTANSGKDVVDTN